MRAVHKPVYTPEEEEFLDWYNRFVPLWLYIGIMALLLFSGIANFAHTAVSEYNIKHHRSLRRPKSISQMGRTSVEYLPDAVSAWWKKNSYKRSRVAEWLGMESAAQLAIVVGYYVLVFAIAFSGAMGHIDYQAHHCARLFNANLPLLVGLAAKELSFISWVTGVSHETLNVFHRWIARLLLILSCVHVGGRVYTNDPIVNPSLPHNRYQAWGIVAFVFFAVLILGSTRPVRRRWFKFFMFGHIGVFILALVCLSVHRPQVSPFTIAALILYSSDRIMRAVQLIYYNFFKGVKSTVGGVDGPPSATIEVLTNDTLHVIFHTARRWSPGQHAYLHFPLLSAGGHPFSICTIPPSPQVFLIRVRSGLTKSLRDSAIVHSSSGLPVSIWPAWSEGPYGGGLRVDQYETVCLVVGGSGVGFASALAMDLVRKWKEGSSRLVTKRLFWVWTVKDVAHVDWISEILQEVLPDSEEFLIFRVYVTGSKSRLSQDDEGPSSQAIEVDEEETQGLREDEPSLGRVVSVFESSGHLSLSHRSSTRTTVPFSRDSDTQTLTRSPSASSTHASYYTTPDGGSETATVRGGEIDSRSRAPSSIAESEYSMLESSLLSHHGDASYATRDTSRTTLAEGSTAVPLYSGRPNLRGLVDEIIGVSDYSDSVWVGTCGPKGLTSEVGEVVADAIDVDKVCMGEQRRNLNFHSEMFGW